MWLSFQFYNKKWLDFFILGRENKNTDSTDTYFVDDEKPVPQLRTVPKRKAKENILTGGIKKGYSDEDDEYDVMDNDEEDEDFEPDWVPVVIIPNKNFLITIIILLM